MTSTPTHTTTPESNSREAYIVLHVAGRALPIDPASPISVSVDADNKRVYTFRPSASSEKGPAPDEVTISVSHHTEDVDTLESVLAQYADVSRPGAVRSSSPPPPYQPIASSGGGGADGMHIDDPSLRGRLVLMDESSGEVVGELPELSFQEDPALAKEDQLKKSGDEAGPVILELPPEVYDAYTSGQNVPMSRARKAGEDLIETREVFVRAIPDEEQDWITRSATVMRCVPYSKLLPRKLALRLVTVKSFLPQHHSCLQASRLPRRIISNIPHRIRRPQVLRPPLPQIRQFHARKHLHHIQL